MTRIILILSIIFVTHSSVAQAYETSFEEFEILFEPFSAKEFSSNELRILQMMLAVKGYYSGVLDGKWGPISRSALNTYSQDEFEVPPTFTVAAFLFIEWIDEIKKNGWTFKYIRPLNVSVLLPESPVSSEYEDEDENGTFDLVHYWIDMQNRASVLMFSHTFTEMQAKHNAISQYSSSYTERQSRLWVSSGTLPDGNLIYIRSEYTKGAWSLISIVAAPEGFTMASVIASSITRGRHPEVTVPENGFLMNLLFLATKLVKLEESKNAGGKVNETPPDQSDPKSLTVMSSGSGFYVNKEAVVLTNNHVVEECRSITINNQSYKIQGVSIEYDLAILVPLSTRTILDYAQFSAKPAKLNSDVTVVGFPLQDILGGLNVTRGAITSQTRLQSKTHLMQISAPVQPGNSGGPVLGKNSAVIGIVVSKLDALEVLEHAGVLPENINFAIRGGIAKLFLTQMGVNFDVSLNTRTIEPTDLADKAAKYTVLVAWKPLYL